MYLDLSPDIPDGDFAAHVVSPDEGSPWAIIRLADGVRLTSLTAGDCERIIRAAALAKARLERAIEGTPHEFAVDALSGYCELCGIRRSHPIHEVTAPVAGTPFGATRADDCDDSGDDPTDSVGEGHDADAAAAAEVPCSCGWTGPGRDSETHRRAHEAALGEPAPAGSVLLAGLRAERGIDA